MKSTRIPCEPSPLPCCTTQPQPIEAAQAEAIGSDSTRPDDLLLADERSRLLADALAQIPFEQRETIMLHLKGGLKFKQIASLQQVSISTVNGRYRYGLKKLRTLLNGELET